MYYYRQYYPTCIEQNFGNLRHKIKTKFVESQGNDKTCSVSKYSQIPYTDLQLNLGGSSSFSCLGNTKLQNEGHKQMYHSCKCQRHLNKHVRIQKHLKCGTNKYNDNYNLSACVKCFPTTSCSYHKLPLNYQKSFKKCDCKFQCLKISNDIESIKHKNSSEEMGSDQSKLRNLGVSNQQTLYDSSFFKKQPCTCIISDGTPIDRLTDESNLICSETCNQNKYQVEKATSNLSNSIPPYHGTNSAASICQHCQFCLYDHLRKKYSIVKTYRQKCDYAVTDTLQSDFSKEIFRRSIDSSSVRSINYMDALNIHVDPKLKTNSNTQIGEYNCRQNNGKHVKNYLHRSKPKLNVSSIMSRLKKNHLKYFYKHDDIKVSKFSDSSKEYNIDKNNYQNSNITNTTIYKQDSGGKKIISGANIKNEIRNISFERNNKGNNIVHNNKVMQKIAYNQLQTNYEFVDKLPRIISENIQETGSSYNSEESASSFKETTTTTVESRMEISKNIKQYRLKKRKKQVLKKECTNKSLLKLVHPIKNHQIFNKKAIRNRMLLSLNGTYSLNNVYNRKKRNIESEIGKKNYCKGEICPHLLGNLSSATIYSSNPRIIPRLFRKRRQKYRTISSKRICWNKQYNDSCLNKLNQHCIKDVSLSSFYNKDFLNLKIRPDVTSAYVVKVGDACHDVVSNTLNPSEQENKPGTQTENLLNNEKSLDQRSAVTCSTCGTLCSSLCISSLILLACKNLAAKGDQNIQEESTTFNKNDKGYIRPEQMPKQEANKTYNQCTCSSKQRTPLTRNVSTMVKRRRWHSSSVASFDDSDVMKSTENRNQNAKTECSSTSSEYGDNLPSFSAQTGELETTSTSLFDSLLTFHGINNSQSDVQTNTTSSYDSESKSASLANVKKIPHGTCIHDDKNTIKHVSKTYTQLQSILTNHSTSLKKTCNCFEVTASETNYDIIKKYFTDYKSDINFDNDTDGYVANKTQSEPAEYTSFAKPGDPLTDKLMSAVPRSYDYPTSRQAKSNNSCLKRKCICYKSNSNGYSTESIQSERPQREDRSMERPHSVGLPPKSGAQPNTPYNDYTIDKGMRCSSPTNSLESCKRFVDDLNFINPLRSDTASNKIRTCDPEEKKQTSEEKKKVKNEQPEEIKTSETRESKTYEPTKNKPTFQVKTIDVHLPVQEKQTFEVKSIDVYKPSELNELDTCQEPKCTCVTPTTSQIAFKQANLQETSKELEDIYIKVTAREKYEPTEEKETSEIKENDNYDPRKKKQTFEIKEIDRYEPTEEKQTVEVKKIDVSKPPALNKLDICEKPKCTCVTPTSQPAFKQTKFQQTTFELEEIFSKVTSSDSLIYLNANLSSAQIISIKKSVSCQYSLTDINLKQNHVVYPQATGEGKELIITEDEYKCDQQIEETKPPDEHSKEMLKEENRPICNRIQCTCDIIKDEPRSDQQTEETKPCDEHSKETLKEEHRPVCVRALCNCEDIGTVRQTKSELDIVSNVEDIPEKGHNEEEITSKSIRKTEVQNNMLSSSPSLTELPTAFATESDVVKKKLVSSDSFILHEVKQYNTVPKKETKQKLPQQFVSTKPSTIRATSSKITIKPKSKQPSVIAIRDKATKYSKETKSTKTGTKNSQRKVRCINKTNLQYETVDTKVYFKITKPRSFNRNYCFNTTPIHHSHKCVCVESTCKESSFHRRVPRTEKQQEHNLISGDPSKTRRL